METLRLSENLYPVDEIYYTLLQSIIGKSSIREIAYWICELARTDDVDGVANGLVYIACIAYSVGNPGLIEYVRKKAARYKQDQDEIHLLAIAQNLRCASSNPHGHALLCILDSESGVTKVFKTAVQHSLDRKWTGLFTSIHHKDMQCVAAYINHFGHEESLQALIEWGKQVTGTDLSEDLPDDVILQLACVVARMFDFESHIAGKRRLRIAPKQKVLEQIREIYNTDAEKYWKRLERLRLYKSADFVGPKTWMRYSVKSLHEASWYSWEYYCYDSKLWTERFQQFGAVKDEDSLSVKFPGDDELEAFYELYCRDFDEQPSCVQDMSLHPIEKIACPYEWYNRCIENTIVEDISAMSI